MYKTMTRVLVSIILLLGSAGVFAGTDAVVVENPWVREAPPFSKVLGAYLTVKNSGEQNRILTGASSPAFERVEMHKTEIRDGVASMIRQDTLEVPANGALVFESGGYHLMLIGPRTPLKAGDHVEMSLLFSNGDSLPFSAEVRKDMDGMGGMNMKNMPGMGGMKEMKMEGM